MLYHSLPGGANFCSSLTPCFIQGVRGHIKCNTTEVLIPHSSNNKTEWTYDGLSLPCPWSMLYALFVLLSVGSEVKKWKCFGRFGRILIISQRSFKITTRLNRKTFECKKFISLIQMEFNLCMQIQHSRIWSILVVRWESKVIQSQKWVRANILVRRQIQK